MRALIQCFSIDLSVGGPELPIPADVSALSVKAEQAPLCPIVFDLVGAGLENAFESWGVAFDMDGDGDPEQMRWLSPCFACLALDHNGDGRSGSGLKSRSPRTRPRANTDLEALPGQQQMPTTRSRRRIRV